MREIKFRAYDGAEWFYGTTINYNKHDKQWSIYNNSTESWSYCGKPYQFTGLKDKNGREIYEGDIVAYLDSYDTSTESGYDFEEFINKGEIVFNEKYGRFDVTNRSDIDYFDFIECVEEYEVVGKIYESPSLIK